MGAANSSNYITESIYTTTSLINKGYQDCGSIVSQEQIIDIEGCDNVDIEHVKMDQVFKLDQSCVSKNDTENSVKQAVDTAIKQASESLIKDYGIGVADATNVTKSFTSINTVIANTFVQNCDINGTMLQKIKCKDSNNFLLDNVEMKQTLDATIDCVQKNNSVNEASTEASTDIDQTAKATVSGINWTLVIIFLIIAMIAAGGGIEYVFVKEASAITDPKILAGQVIIVGIIFLVVWVTNSWWIFKPFKAIWDILYKILKAFSDVLGALTKAL